MCPTCRAEVDSDVWFCPSCNAPLHEHDQIIPAGDEPPELSANKVDTPATASRDTPHGSADPVEPDSPGRIFRQQLQRSWLIRILVTVVILAILIGALLLISSTRKGAGGAIPVAAAATAFSLAMTVSKRPVVDYDNEWVSQSKEFAGDTAEAGSIDQDM